MKLALVEAQKAYDKDEVPIGAIVVCKNRIIAHAEMQAITAAANHIGGKYLNECTLYVTVEPCPMCAGALGWSQLGRLVYGAGDEKRGYRRYAPDVLHPRTEVVEGVCSEESTALMKKFFANKR